MGRPTLTYERIRRSERTIYSIKHKALNFHSAPLELLIGQHDENDLSFQIIASAGASIDNRNLRKSGHRTPGVANRTSRIRRC
jgi:hypothetical protein